MSKEVSPCLVVIEGERRGLKFNERRVKRTQEDQAMNPIVRTHTKEDMSIAKEGKQEDTMSKETNCNTVSSSNDKSSAGQSIISLIP